MGFTLKKPLNLLLFLFIIFFLITAVSLNFKLSQRLISKRGEVFNVGVYPSNEPSPISSLEPSSSSLAYASCSYPGQSCYETNQTTCYDSNGNLGMQTCSFTTCSYTSPFTCSQNSTNCTSCEVIIPSPSPSEEPFSSENPSPLPSEEPSPALEPSLSPSIQPSCLAHYATGCDNSPVGCCSPYQCKNNQCLQQLYSSTDEAARAVGAISPSAVEMYSASQLEEGMWETGLIPGSPEWQMAMNLPGYGLLATAGIVGGLAAAPAAIGALGTASLQAYSYVSALGTIGTTWVGQQLLSRAPSAYNALQAYGPKIAQKVGAGLEVGGFAWAAYECSQGNQMACAGTFAGIQMYNEQQLINSILTKSASSPTVVISDIHSDVQGFRQAVQQSGLRTTGDVVSTKKAVIMGDYFGKTTPELITGTNNPGYQALNDTLDLIEQSQGRVTGMYGNWEIRAAQVARSEARLAANADDIAAAGDLLRLKDKSFYVGDMEVIGANTGTFTAKISQLETVHVDAAGKVFQHSDTANTAKYIFASKEEAQNLISDPELLTKVKAIIDTRGKGVLTADDLEALQQAAKNAGLGQKEIVGRINQNVNNIVKSEVGNASSSIPGKSALDRLAADFDANMQFVQDPEAAIAFHKLVSGKGTPELIHGHTPADDIAKALEQQVGCRSLGACAYGVPGQLKIQVVDVRLSSGARVSNAADPRGFFPYSSSGLIDTTQGTLMQRGYAMSVQNPWLEFGGGSRRTSYMPAYLIPGWMGSGQFGQ